MATPVDFAKLSAADILDLAAFIEHEAQERYESFAEHLAAQGDGEAAAFFRMMAAVESSHATAVAGRRSARFPDPPARLRDVIEWDVEGPPLDRNVSRLSRDAAVALALASEARAYEFFAGAAEHLVGEAAAAVLAELRDDELGHIRMLEDYAAGRPVRSPAPDATGGPDRRRLPTAGGQGSALP